jgi:cytidine deaminase
VKQGKSVQERELVAHARQARMAAHAPYSGFRVGAAVRLRDGRIFAGCNVENASLGAAICAERSALVQAVTAGAKPGDLQAVAVYTTAGTPTPPCGMCLQCLVEFAGDIPVLLAVPKRMERTSLEALMPRPFRRFPKSRRAAGGGRRQRS